MSNTHIKDYLNYYVALPTSPGYAVMINGAWGVGKTHFIKELVDDFKTQGKLVYWVSLNGIKTFDDIDQRLVVSVAPSLDPKIAAISGRIGSALLKRFGLRDLVEGKDILQFKKPDLIVFDDLERGSLTAVELLGYINQFVEQEELKVLIIANAAEIEKKEVYFKTAKEKVIGETFELQVDVAPALDAFVKGMPNEAARKYVYDNKDALLSIFQQSGGKNLRVLKQVLLSWDRFYAAVDNELREKSGAMLTVFKLFVALCAEVRLGNLSAADLRKRIDSIVAGNMRENKGGPVPPLAAASKKFPELHLHDTVLNDDVLVHVLCEGRIQSEEINECLRHSAYFLRPDQEPAWQKVWYGIARDSEEFEEAFQIMEQQFEARAFVRTGEILHVFGLRLWGAEIEQLKCATSDILAQCKSYVDDLASDGRILNEFDASAAEDHFELGAAYGLAYNSGNKPEFRELAHYYLDAVDDAKRKRWPEEARAVVNLMVSDVSSFFAKVCWTNDSRENTFAVIPIFSTIPAGEFVKSLLTLMPADFRTALTAFKGRYEGNRLKHELHAEEAWLREVRVLLLKEAEGNAPIRKFAIRNEVGRLISPFVEE